MWLNIYAGFLYPCRSWWGLCLGLCRIPACVSAFLSQGANGVTQSIKRSRIRGCYSPGGSHLLLCHDRKWRLRAQSAALKTLYPSVIYSRPPCRAYRTAAPSFLRRAVCEVQEHHAVAVLHQNKKKQATRWPRIWRFSISVLPLTSSGATLHKQEAEDDAVPPSQDSFLHLIVVSVNI